MEKKFILSFFKAPIAKFTDAQGRSVPASLVPSAQISLEQLYQLITQNERIRQLTEEVRSSDNLSEAKKRLLPFITPHGVFSYRKGDSLVTPSHVIVVDLDHLASFEEACRMRERLFADPWLQPALCFISPSGRGVKALVPYTADEHIPPAELITRCLQWCMEYLKAMYGEESVDGSGKDVARACFICHDPEALIRRDLF